MIKISIVLILITLIDCGQKVKTKNQIEKMTEQSYNEEFDSQNLTELDKEILNEFQQRRKIFKDYLSENNLDLYTCPGCGYPTLSERGAYEICEVCNWEDEHQNENEEGKVWSGPNAPLSLIENRLIIGRILNQLADSLNGKVNQDPRKFFEVFDRHNARMNSIDQNKLLDADINDPIWTEYKEKQKMILTDLVTE